MKSISKLAIIAITVVCSGTAAFAQSNPTAQTVPYTNDFSGLTASSTTYPAGWQGWKVATAPGSSFATAAAISDSNLLASATASTTALSIGNYNGKIGFLNTGSGDMALAFAINTTGLQNIQVFYDALTIRNPYDGGSNTRVNEMTLQYRIGTSGTWTSLTGIEYQNNTTTQTTAVTTPQNQVAKVVSLPDTCKNQTVVQLRWISRQVSGGGSRPGFAVDNVGVTATAIPSGVPPGITSLLPSSISTNYGGSATFTMVVTGDAATNFWYQETTLTTNLIAVTAASSNNLTLTALTKLNEGNYRLVLSNTLGSATSSVVSLTVADPYFIRQPASQTAVPNGMAQFLAGAAGSGANFQWYFCASPSDNQQLTAPVANGTLTGGSVVSGVSSATLNISNVQSADVTNYVLVVTGTYGAITSSVASLSMGSSLVSLARWTFNDAFTVSSPEPYLGVGTASAANCTPFVQNVSDATDFDPGTAYAWGTKAYPAAAVSNKLGGVTFRVSTLGAKNISVAFSARVTTSTSKYFRLQITTNGTDFFDYPASTVPTAANVYYDYSYNLSAFPNVRNNPNFGFRVVTEFESTARYGNTNDANYVGFSAAYSNDPNTGGTFSFDKVNVIGDAITDANVPPVVGSLTNLVFNDTTGGTEYFTVVDGDNVTPAGSLTVSAQSLYAPVSLNFSYNNNSGNYELGVNSTLNNSTTVYAPVLVTVSDGTDSTVAWFTATITPGNAAPTISGLINTNMLTNSVLVIPFKVEDDHTVAGSLTVGVFAPYNTGVVPNDGTHLALALNGVGGTNRTLTITPLAGQSGTVPVTVYVGDGTLATTNTFYLAVGTHTNQILAEQFNYDPISSSLVTNAGGFWSHHGGNTNGEIQTTGGQIIIDHQHHAEDVNAPLVGAPYLTNSTAVLYARYNINYTILPNSTGDYFTHFKDNTTFGFFGRVWASSNSPTSYRIGIGNTSGASASSPKVGKDLSLNTSYTIITRMVVSNGVCTVWVNPTSESDIGATDSVPATNLTFVSSYAFRDGNNNGGILNVSNLAVGTTFDSVLYVEPADVSIAQTAPASVLAGGSVTYTLTVSNAGPYAATGIQVTNTLPVGASFVSASGNGANAAGVVRWTLDTLASGAHSNITVTVTAPLSGSLTNYASASANTADLNLANNTAAPAITSVTPTADLSVTKSGPASVFTGNNFTYSITASNAGVSSADNVSVSDTLPSGVTFVSATGGGVNNSGVVSWALGTLANGASSNVTVTVVAAAGGSVTNTASVNSDTLDLNTANNTSAHVITTVAQSVVQLNGFQATGNDFVLTWENGLFYLQSATNVAGPYTHVPGATSPFTNDVKAAPQMFYRLTTEAP